MSRRTKKKIQEAETLGAEGRRIIGAAKAESLKSIVINLLEFVEDLSDRIAVKVDMKVEDFIDLCDAQKTFSDFAEGMRDKFPAPTEEQIRIYAHQLEEKAKALRSLSKKVK